MTDVSNIRSLLAKALRIVLVFTLVSWSSLHVEYLAFGADGDDAFASVTPDDGVAHDAAGDTLTDLVVYEQLADGKWKPVPNATALVEEGKEATITVAFDPEKPESSVSNLVVVPVWTPAAPQEPSAEESSSAASPSGDSPASSPASADASDAAVKPAESEPTPEPEYPDGYDRNDDTKSKELDAITAATFVEAKWAPEDGGEGADALIAVTVTEAKGVFSITPVKNGEGAITFQLTERPEKLSVSAKTIVSGVEETHDIKDATAAFAKDKDKAPYTGDPVEAELEVAYEDEPLVAGTDYEVMYEATGDAKLSEDGKPLEAGSYKVSIKGIGSFTGTKDVEGLFVVEQVGKGLSMEDASIYPIPDQAYTGSEITPEIVVRYTEDGKESTLKLDEDYTVKYEDNIGSVTESTTAKVIVTGKGDYVKSKTIEFIILPPKPELEYVELVYATEGGALVLSADGSELIPVDETLTFEDGGSLDYQLNAKVKMKYDIREYTLAEAKDKFSDLNLQYTWKVADEGATAEGENAADASQASAASGGATIDQQGLLHVTKRGKYKVTCEVSIDVEDDEEGELSKKEEGAGGTEADDAKSGDASQAGNASQTGEADGMESSSSASPAPDSSTASPSADSGASVGTQAAGDESESPASTSTQTVSDSVVVNVGAVDDPQGFSRPQPDLRITAGLGTIAASAEGASGPVVDKTYPAENLAPLATQTRLFNMTTSGKPTTITGKGMLLLDLLKKAYADSGQDLSTVESQIESVSFENYKGTAKTIPWTFLSNASTSCFVALDSYVHQPSDDASSPASASKLVSNTRFRLLFDYTSSLSGENQNADDYRWLKAISVNYKTTESGNLTVGISYTPVPKGVSAEFVAVPNHMINGKWDCMWEVCTKEHRSSNGEPRTWTTIEGETGQTLRVMTSNDTIGNLYRVTIDNNTNLTNGEKNKELVATSDPEELREGAGIVLSYNPPRAGDMAIFKSSIYNYSGDVSKLEYVWEWSDNGGVSWNELKGEKKSTLKIPTEPVTNDGSASDGATPTLVYIRVRAIPPTGDPMVSNAQPLTVHVGEDDSDAGGDDENGKTSTDNQKKGGETEKPDSKDESKPKAETDKPAPREVGRIAPDFTDFTDEDDFDDEYDFDNTAQALDPDGSAISEVLINESVNEKVAEQEKARQEYLESTTPGARWTALNTLEPNGDDISRVLEDNPFAPFVVPFGLGITAAGGVEKLLSFRRQVDKSVKAVKRSVKPSAK